MIDSRSGRWICCEERPYDPNNPEHRKHRWVHPDDVFLRENHYSDGESYEVYKCPHCGLIFDVTIPK